MGELAGKVAFEAAEDRPLGEAFGGPPGGVGAAPRAGPEPDDSDQVQRSVGRTVPAGLEAAAGGVSGRGRDRVSGAQVREGGLAPQAGQVPPGADEQLAGVGGVNTRAGGRARRGRRPSGKRARWASRLSGCGASTGCTPGAPMSSAR